jgi:hypothetical protein
MCIGSAGLEKLNMFYILFFAALASTVFLYAVAYFKKWKGRRLRILKVAMPAVTAILLLGVYSLIIDTSCPSPEEAYNTNLNACESVVCYDDLSCTSSEACAYVIDNAGKLGQPIKNVSCLTLNAPGSQMVFKNCRFSK